MSNEIPEHSNEIAYFPPATPEAQLQACATTLSRLSVLLLPHLGGEAYVTLLDVAELAGNASADPVLSQSEVEAARLIDATVMLASAYLFDGMRPVSSNTSPMPGTSVYARLYGSQGDPYGYRPDFSFGFGAAGDVHAVTHDELNARIKEWQTAGTMLPVATPAEFASLYAIDKKGPYYFTRPLSHDEANHVVRICEAAAPDALYLPINLSHERSCFLILTNTSSTERTPFMPRTELPQQDFWRALLERGVALLNDNPSLDVFPFDSTQPPFSSSEISAALDELLATNEIAGRANQLPNARDAVRRDIVNLLARQRLGEEYGAWVARLLEGHTRHYGRLLGGKYHTLGTPEVLLTRSGVSSIDAAFRALQKQLERQAGDPPLAYALGIYYENEPDTHFTTTDDPNAASVMLVNVEPNAPDTDNSWPLGYEARRAFALNAIRQNALAELERAKKSGEEPKLYYLVLDTTTDLLFRPYTNKERIPPNLRIIEVASLTKHQRGERNYFLGWQPTTLTCTLQTKCMNT